MPEKKMEAATRGCTHESLEERYVGSITDGGAVVVCDECGASWTPEEAPGRERPGEHEPPTVDPPSLESVALADLRERLAETDGGAAALPLVVAISYKHGADVGEMAEMYGTSEITIGVWLRQLEAEPLDAALADPVWSVGDGQ